MQAAVVTSFQQAPAFGEFPAPTPAGPDEILVDVLASALHPRVRSQADGSHYTSTDQLPLVPGVDGVGRAADGTLYYFILLDSAHGAMAQQTLIDPRRSIVLPADADPVPLAAAMNPAMSSWVALRRRTTLTPGQSVLVLGATGSAGRMAVQVAKHLGAGRVVAAGRDPRALAELPALGADSVISIAGAPDEAAERVAAAAADTDVVIDYLWGAPTVAAMTAIVTRRADPAQPLTWIQIGSVAGREAAIPSAALRACRLQIIGSGQGSVPTRDIAAELPALAERITAGDFAAETRVVPLAQVEKTWDDAGDGKRVVFIP